MILGISVPSYDQHVVTAEDSRSARRGDINDLETLVGRGEVGALSDDLDVVHPAWKRHTGQNGQARRHAGVQHGQTIVIADIGNCALRRDAIDGATDIAKPLDCRRGGVGQAVDWAVGRRERRQQRGQQRSQQQKRECTRTHERWLLPG